MHTPARRLHLDFCALILIDVQNYFLKSLETAQGEKIVLMTSALAELAKWLRIPTLCTVEKPVASKGSMPERISEKLTPSSLLFEKNFFDLMAEKEIAAAVSGLDRRQLIVTGCETDVCVLQSCLGLLAEGYEVYVVEDLLFSSSKDVQAALARMQSAGATFVTYKTLFYELVRSIEDSPHRRALEAKFGKMPNSLLHALEFHLDGVAFS